MYINIATTLDGRSIPYSTTLFFFGGVSLQNLSVLLILQRFNDQSAILPEWILFTLFQHQQVCHLFMSLTLTLAPPFRPHHTPQEAFAASLYKLGIRNSFYLLLLCFCRWRFFQSKEVILCWFESFSGSLVDLFYFIYCWWYSVYICKELSLWQYQLASSSQVFTSCWQVASGGSWSEYSNLFWA